MPQPIVDMSENLTSHSRTPEAQLHGTQYDDNFGAQIQFDKRQAEATTTRLLNTAAPFFQPSSMPLATQLHLTEQQFHSYQQHTRVTDDLYATITQRLQTTHLCTSKPPLADFQVSTQQPVFQNQFNAFSPISSDRENSVPRSNSPSLYNRHQPTLINFVFESTLQSTTRPALQPNFDGRVYGPRTTRPETSRLDI